MGKIINNTNVVEENATSKFNGKVKENKIRKKEKLKLRNFVQSPETQQTHEISTWLNTNSTKSFECSSKEEHSNSNSEKVDINLNTKPVRKKWKRIKDNSSIDVAVQREVSNTRPKTIKETIVKTSPRMGAHSPQNHLSSFRKQLFSEFEVSSYATASDIEEDQVNNSKSHICIDETALKKAVLQHSPDSKHKKSKKKHSDSSKSSSGKVSKTYKKKHSVSLNGTLNTWLTTDKKEKNKLVSNEKSSGEEKSRKKKVQNENSKKDYKDKSQENLQLDSRTVKKSNKDESMERPQEKVKSKKKAVDTCRVSQEKETSNKIQTLEIKTKSKEKDKMSSKKKLDSTKSSTELSSKKSKLVSSNMEIKHKSTEGNNKNYKGEKEHRRSSEKIEKVENKAKKIVTKKSSNREIKESNKVCEIKKPRNKEKENSNSKKSKENRTKLFDMFKKQGNLDKYIEKHRKEMSKKTKSCDSANSVKLSSMANTSEKSKSNNSSESFKKYGVTLPTIEEILKEQRDLENYKNQIQAFQEIEFENFDFSVEDFSKTETNSVPILGCKHLSLEEITELFKENLTYTSDIFFGKTYNERHNKFFNLKKGNNVAMLNELTQSTSMVVFSFEQKHHMIKLLKEQFDPQDQWTSYFFQVLLHELCLKIFMDMHGMSHQKAVEYLDIRPIDD